MVVVVHVVFWCGKRRGHLVTDAWLAAGCGQGWLGVITLGWL
jgi:hypothetical protein